MAATQVTPYRTVDGAAVMRRVGWRIVPFLVLCYFIAYVDRVNAGFAALTMNKDLGLSQAMFGIGGGHTRVTGYEVDHVGGGLPSLSGSRSQSYPHRPVKIGHKDYRPNVSASC